MPRISSAEGKRRDRVRSLVWQYGTTIIYVLTKEGVDEIAKSIGLRNLSAEHYRMARKYITSFCSDGVYTWVNAITDALKDTEQELRGEYYNLVSEE